MDDDSLIDIIESFEDLYFDDIDSQFFNDEKEGGEGYDRIDE